MTFVIDELFFFLKREIDIENSGKNGSHAFVFFSDFVSDIYFVNKNKVSFLFKELIFLFKDCEVNDDKKEIESSSPKVSLKKKEIIKNMVFKELFSFHLMDFLKKDLEVYHLS